MILVYLPAKENRAVIVGNAKNTDAIRRIASGGLPDALAGSLRQQHKRRKPRSPDSINYYSESPNDWPATNCQPYPMGV